MTIFIKLSFNHFKGATIERFKSNSMIKMGMDVKVAERFLNYVGNNLGLKTYVFDVVEHKRRALNILDNFSKYFERVGEFGVAFLYEYSEDNGISYVGADVSIFRGTLEDLDKDNNPMIHSWTIENIEELHRNKDGTMCAIEAIILGKECELIRKRHGEDVPTFRKRILHTWPDIDDLLSENYKQPSIPKGVPS